MRFRPPWAINGAGRSARSQPRCEISRNVSFGQIAERAGVSVSSVERVLNERGSVSETVRMKVVAAARSLGARRVLPEVAHGIAHIEVILPRNPTPFWRLLDTVFHRIAAQLPRHVRLHRTFVAQNNPAALSEAVLRPSFPRRGLIIAADATAEILPSLTTVMARGEPVITLATDVPGLPEHLYSGIDNHAAGRTAGHLMRRLLRGTGSVLLLMATDRRQEHHARVAGFRAALGEGIALRVAVTQEVAGETGAILARALRDGAPDGIYATGHDSHEIAPLLTGRDPRPVWITHERTPLHRRYLRDGLLDFVIDQDPEAQALWAMQQMARACGLEIGMDLSVKRPEQRLFCAENLPDEGPIWQGPVPR